MRISIRSMTCRALAISVLASLSACAVVELSPEGAGVRLASRGAVATCVNLGRTTASVIHKVGFLPRQADTVQEEISVTARNSAAKMGADTIVPAGNVQDGKQTFDVYRCLR